jgi:hypothetical protein
MMTQIEARQFAQSWVLAWNAHDLDAIMAHYASEVVLTSPVAAKLLNDHQGKSLEKKHCEITSPGGSKPTQTSPSRSWMSCVDFQVWFSIT